MRKVTRIIWEIKEALPVLSQGKKLVGVEPRRGYLVIHCLYTV